MVNESDFYGDDFMTVGEVAELLRVSKMTIYRMVHSGEMLSIRLGRSFRLPRRSVDNYIRSSMTGLEPDTLTEVSK